MSQLKQPIFLKKIKKVINTIPGLEEQIFACRNKKRVTGSFKPSGLFPPALQK